MTVQDLPEPMLLLQVDAPSSLDREDVRRGAVLSAEAEVGSGERGPEGSSGASGLEEQLAGLQLAKNPLDVISLISHDYLRSSSIPHPSLTEAIPVNPTSIHILTLDDVVISVPYSLLAKYSTFITDLPDFPLVKEGDAGILHLELPSATSGGMKLLIELLQVKEHTSYVSNDALPWSTIGMTNLQPIVDALIIADAYLMPSFTSILVESAARHLKNKPFLAWSAYALAGSNARLDKRQINMRLQPTLESMPKHANAILRRHASGAYSSFLRLRKGWTALTASLRTQLSSRTSMRDGVNEYYRMCRGQPPVRAPCRSYGRQPDWAKLRGEMANQALDLVARPTGTIDAKDIERVLGSATGCHRCATRLAQTFLPAVKVFKRPASRYVGAGDGGQTVPAAEEVKPAPLRAEDGGYAASVSRAAMGRREGSHGDTLEESEGPDSGCGVRPRGNPDYEYMCRMMTALDTSN